MSNSIGLKIDLREILAIGNTACKFFDVIEDCMPLNIECRLQLKNNGVKICESEDDIVVNITLLK